MKIRQVIFLISTILILTSCRRGYKIEGDEVYYETWNEGSGQNLQLIEQADAKTFQKLILESDSDFEFGKDKNHLFINGELINNIDPKTFKYIGNYIYRDKKMAYFFGAYNNLNDCGIKGVNPDKIKLIKYPWARTDNLLIHGRDTLYLNDINDFKPIDEHWGKTKKYVINENRILYGADLETFKIINGFTGKDSNYNYEFGFISRSDFKKINYKTFDFTQKNLCENGLMEFVDIYNNFEPLVKDQDEKIVIVEKLKIQGFTLKNKRQGNWSSGPKIISVTLSNDKCDCYIDKLYYYDYSEPSETEKVFRVTERVNCKLTASK